MTCTNFDIFLLMESCHGHREISSEKGVQIVIRFSPMDIGKSTLNENDAVVESSAKRSLNRILRAKLLTLL
jgi:hypothetical protein